MTEPAQPARANRFARLQAATDRVPTKWFATIGTVLFLAVTAAFGGLNEVAAAPTPALPELTAGEVHTSAQLSIRVERAVLIDELSGTGAFPDEEKGERLLVLLVEVENRWDEALQLSPFSSFSTGRVVRLSGDDRAADGIVREDDQTPDPWLQPGIPTLLAFSWTVGGADYTDGEELIVELSDSPLEVGELLFTGERWGAPALAATVRIAIEDVGAEGDG
ncbi:MAG: hypothetical protein P0Y48_10240 [Candidatus Microbacterium phytovorans]|uniref:DUF4352 domain-containing protein n=1 Tax=Candidatus Microbacterium phytovorans TaxID=3121374 RepID=A0AAJ5W1T0_9MICO|nr:hypothetical protein [Microbacterium sp.]WEK12840.1 MAG: hypothetical protein P0Y48_10240 [Microbacterium sp.]